MMTCIGRFLPVLDCAADNQMQNCSLQTWQTGMTGLVTAPVCMIYLVGLAGAG